LDVKLLKYKTENLESMQNRLLLSAELKAVIVVQGDFLRLPPK
jgi:hypothetical protein